MIKLLLPLFIIFNIYSNEKYDVFDNLLMQVEAVDRDEFLKTAMKKKVDGCSILHERYQKYKENPAIRIRVFYYLKDSKCAKKLEMAEEGLKSENTVVVLNALRLILSFEKSERKTLRPSLTAVAKRFNKDKTIATLVKQNLAN